MVILGSTGSIGTQSLQIATKFGIKIEALAARKNVKLLNEQIAKFAPKFVYIEDENLVSQIDHLDHRIVFFGKDGIEKMAELMAGLRENVKDTLIGKKIKIKRDFDSHKEYNLETGEEKEIHLPKENVLQFVLEDNTFITARPSGTEPKIKFYFSVNSDSNENVKEKLAKTMEEFEKFLNL